MPDLAYYWGLLAQHDRIEAFRRAITGVVRPGDRVLDVGTGLGTFAFFAADAGACTVWAVDGEPVVHVAKAIGTLNAYDDRIEWVRGWLPDVDLPEPVDVFIFEDFPSPLLAGTVFELLRAVHDKYAAPGVRAIPAGAELFLAPVSSEELYARLGLAASALDRYGVDWSPVRPYVANAAAQVHVPADALAGAKRRVGTLRFDVAPSTRDMDAPADWRFEEPTTIHGLAYWFDLDLGAGETLSNAPGATPGSWGHLFLPVDPPIAADAGTSLEATVGSDARADGTPRWLWWEVVAGDERRRGHEFAAHPAALGDLVGASPDGVPRLALRGELEALVLHLTDGRRTVREIAEAVAAERGMSQGEAERLVVRVLRDRIQVGSTLEAARGAPWANRTDVTS
ncbi:MAG: class I SAM-dependent methyltransferase [Gemmatimonadales bacterium]